MGWSKCTVKEAQEYANEGTAVVAVSDERIAMVAANDDESEVASTSSVVMTLDENTSALAVADMAFYANSRAGTTYDSFYFPKINLSIDVGWHGYNPLVGDSTTVEWSSNNSSVATVDDFGNVTTHKAGIVKITARKREQSDNYEIWVRGKTPIFLIHGRTSNTEVIFGIKTAIIPNSNDDHDPSINAEASNGEKYIDVSAQEIIGFRDNSNAEETPYYLGNKLKDAGYILNRNMFAFNYPNEDAVVHNAIKFERYIQNLIADVRNSSNNERKAYFYASRADYTANNYKINIIGHSMGGLIGRYYIENLGHDHYVEKLITICTPHWGTGYAGFSSATGIMHELCDHDLQKDSKMFGGNESTNLFCLVCGSYTMTNTLNYSQPRNTAYYAIAGVAYSSIHNPSEEHIFEIESPGDYETFSQLINRFISEGIYENIKDLGAYIDIMGIGDNLVGFLSQIGWTETGSSSPTKKVGFSKICICVDKNGNSIISRLHSKIPFKQGIAEKIISYLNE